VYHKRNKRPDTSHKCRTCFFCAFIVKFSVGAKIQKGGLLMKDEEIIETLKRENEEFRKLYQEHRELDSMLSEIDKKHYVTPEEELEIHRLKKEKLSKKDKIAELIKNFKSSLN
jgi:uncharacterized protein YdcH (DUF465 family)